MILKKDNKNRDLGFVHNKCRICGAEGEFRSWMVREMLYGTRNEFVYFECPECICLQITEVPDNLGDYYSNGYYSFTKELDNNNLECSINTPGKILDVGCGNGEWLFKKAAEGYKELYGCDPFLENDMDYGNVIHIRKTTIHDVVGRGEFDLIHMGDSLEHTTDPVDVLVSAYRLLKTGGKIEIAIPTWPNAAFDVFGVHWFQIDAPRHIFLPSKKCIEYMAGKAGLCVEKIEYDSQENQFVASFFYEHGIPMIELSNEIAKSYFSMDEIKQIRQMVLNVNKQHRGDHMSVVMVKS